jgi:membrane protein DedA with SNARE-associated domain
MLDVVSQWVAHYGYLIVALFLFVEGAGLPVPGETALVTAAALAGRGTLSLVGVIIAGCAGTIAGGHAGYWIGARGGAALVKRHGRWFGVTEKRLERTHEFFAHHGAKTVALGRFVAFVRSFVGIFAGVSGMPMGKFAAYNALGGSVWVATFSVLGYAFGKNLPRLVRYMGRVSLLLAILIAFIVLAVFGWRWFQRNRAAVVASLDQAWERVTTTARMTELRARHPKLARFVSGNFARGEYIAVHLVTGFAASLAVIALFASITEGLVDSSPLTRFDVTVADRLNQAIGLSTLSLLQTLSGIGGRGAMTLLLLVGVLLYTLRGRGVELAGWCAAFVGGSLLDASLRFVVRRSELPFADIVLVNWGTGLASGHVLGVLVGYGMLAYLIGTFARSAAARTAIVVCAAILVAAIVAARLCLGQAYVSDASAGMAAGLLWLITCVSAIQIARERRWGG